MKTDCEITDTLKIVQKIADSLTPPMLGLNL